MDSVAKLGAKEGKVKALPWSELNTIRVPRGWIWVPRPYLCKDKLLKIIEKQNPDFNTARWSVVAEGKQKPYGQHFLIKICNEDMEKLKEKNMMLRVGVARSTFKIDGDSSQKAVEPDAPDTACEQMEQNQN